MATHMPVHHDQPHHVRNTVLTAAGLVAGFLALMALACAFMPTIPLPHY